MSEQEISRLQKWRLGILYHVDEVTHSVAKTCRYYGIGRTAYYEWYKRYHDIVVNRSTVYKILKRLNMCILDQEHHD